MRLDREQGRKIRPAMSYYCLVVCVEIFEIDD